MEVYGNNRYQPTAADGPQANVYCNRNLCKNLKVAGTITYAF